MIKENRFFFFFELIDRHTKRESRNDWRERVAIVGGFARIL